MNVMLAIAMLCMNPGLSKHQKSCQKKLSLCVIKATPKKSSTKGFDAQIQLTLMACTAGVIK